jgi:hypothetical protein
MRLEEERNKSGSNNSYVEVSCPLYSNVPISVGGRDIQDWSSGGRFLLENFFLLVFLLNYPTNLLLQVRDTQDSSDLKAASIDYILHPLKYMGRTPGR